MIRVSVVPVSSSNSSLQQSSPEQMHEHRCIEPCVTWARAIVVRLSVLLLALIMVAGCVNTHPDVDNEVLLLPDVPARELLLGAEPFPRNWIADPCGTDCNDAEGETHAYRSFGIPNVAGHVNQDVHYFDSVDAAVAQFERSVEVDFSKSPQLPSTAFRPPAQIPYRSPIADEFYLGCGIRVIDACRAILRYENYFVEFFFVLDDPDTTNLKDGLALQEVEPILQAMDGLIVEQFDLPRSALQATPQSRSHLAYSPSPTPPATVGGLIEALGNENGEARSGAAQVLGRMGAEAEPAVPALITALNDDVTDVRLAAARALGKIGPSASSATSALTHQLPREESEYVRMQIAMALGQIGNPSAVPALASALEDPNTIVARHAAESLMPLTGKNFYYAGNNVYAFDEEGRIWVVRLAQEWWKEEGRYMDWSSLP